MGLKTSRQQTTDQQRGNNKKGKRYKAFKFGGKRQEKKGGRGEGRAQLRSTRAPPANPTPLSLER
jgi:hypothetical protein